MSYAEKYKAIQDAALTRLDEGLRSCAGLGQQEERAKLMASFLEEMDQLSNGLAAIV